MTEPPFTMGVEEEYLVVDKDSRELVQDPSQAVFEECREQLGAQVSPEFLRSQIEVETGICTSIAELRADLVRLRKTVAQVTAEHGLAPMAASTHPFSQWQSQKHTDKERYNVLARDMQAVARRLVICGMHVHVGIGNDELRIDLMNQITYFLPHLLALSTSSPFWLGEKTGLMSYRISVWDELPRTGLPEHFESYGEYKRHVDIMTHAGLIEDATKIWWDVRPSGRYPTLELRISDICTRLDDVVTIAALYVCLLRMLYRLRRDNQRWRIYSRFLINENRWRAHRYGIDDGLVDFGKGQVTPFPELLEELIELIAEDIEFFQCADEIENARAILKRGTSSHRQIAVYDEAVAGGAAPEEALKAVVDMLVAETVAGL
ncbi:MAG: carboxylate-amine ligase [Alphaproteobacteria bacterium]|nr:carboxylate-amine ligase [Alphaproteobacteria bacterium]